MIINNDSLHALKELEDSSIDLVATDPPYGYSFMGKDWDKAVPSVEIWKECLRVLKPGAFCFVMSAPRSDVQNAMISRLMEAGFRLDFTPIYWTYASGFPKAMNMGKAAEGKITNGSANPKDFKKLSGTKVQKGNWGMDSMGAKHGYRETDYSLADEQRTVKVDFKSPQAKALDGSYAGYQPKPAVEVIIVAMKPLSEKTYVDQAMKNGKGITWLDDVRVPTTETIEVGRAGRNTQPMYSPDATETKVYQSQGRFPANLLVSDDILGDHSRFFDLDKWNERKFNNVSMVHTDKENSENKTNEEVAQATGLSRPDGLDTLPFIAIPKASKREKNEGLEAFEEKKKWLKGGTGSGISDRENVVAKNFHPTVKPIKLMSYLITLGSRKGDTVLDPFVGSGTTAVAAKLLKRIPIGIEREEEYAEIARARLDHAKIPEPIEDKQTRLV